MIVAPSLLSANFAHLARDIDRLNEAGCQMLHLDIMDGHFVPNISFGSSIVKTLRPLTKMVFDVHLMISDPLKYLTDFVHAGADYITFHYEAVDNPFRIIKAIKAFGIKAGISIKPNTPVSVLEPFLPFLDLVLVMSVEPGFGGQTFMMGAVPKIKQLKALKDQHNYNYLIQVDGGINNQTVLLVKEAGCDIVVAGTYVFSHPNIKEALANLE
ncbi:MAG: ribulose-phosphate 3-epimerase [Bacilli bacterium]|jgi:ribulose-phosphate 3-epimerase|nr:ribulose-phosphate 3-epimerase [Bacilli bacterium]HHU24217.1 ribulose-phosphate 3-epimerase [Acholeplasmataceae bacterium]